MMSDTSLRLRGIGFGFGSHMFRCTSNRQTDTFLFRSDTSFIHSSMIFHLHITQPTPPANLIIHHPPFHQTIPLLTLQQILLTNPSSRQQLLPYPNQPPTKLPPSTHHPLKPTRPHASPLRHQFALHLPNSRILPNTSRAILVKLQC